MEFLPINYEQFVEAHESELVEWTTSFFELLVVLKFVEVITPQEFDAIKVFATKDEQIRYFYRLLSTKGTGGPAKLTLTALYKTSNVQVAKLLKTFLQNDSGNSVGPSCHTPIDQLYFKFSRTQMDRRFHLPNRPTNNQGTPLADKLQTVSAFKDKDNTPNHSYCLKSRPKGYALIVNNQISNLHVNCLDSQNMSQLFHDLGIRSTVVEDLEASELKRTVNSFKKKFHRVEKADCCVIVLLDHVHDNSNNEDGSIKLADGENVFVHDLILQFSKENCPELNEKPKLFFIQSSRKNYEYFKDKEIITLLSERMKDTFVVLFTEKTQQRSCKGTNFIYHLTRVLSKYSSSTEFLSMMNMVSNEMKHSIKIKSSDNELIFYQTFQCKPLWFNQEPSN